MEFERLDALPLAELQSQAARICQKMLRLDVPPRLDENVMELGAEPQALMAVLTELERVFKKKADIEASLANPTIEGICASLRDITSETPGSIPHALRVASVRTEGADDIPPNRIPAGCDAITPEMLPLVRLTAADIARIVDAVPGGAANIKDIYPLAPAQEGVFFHHRLNADADPYLKSIVLAFDTRELLQRFLSALQAVIDRHDILRTAVYWEGLPEPVQVVWRQATLVVEEVDIEADASDVAQRLCERRRDYRFDLRQAPQMQIFIARDARNSRWLMLQRSHEFSLDATSNLIVQQEVDAYLLDRAAQLPPPVPYRNFVAQMRKIDFEEDHKAFFHKMLGDVSEPTLPFGLADLWNGGSDLVEGHQSFDESLTARLQACARANRVSAARIFHLAWALVLARVSGRENVVFGTVLSGRMRGGSGGTPALGPFTNILPLHVRVGDASVTDGLRQTHILLLQMLLHEHAPLMLVQRCSAVAAPTPLFSSLFNYRRDAAVKPYAPIEGIRQLDFQERNNFPLTLAVDQKGSGFAWTVRMAPVSDPQRVCAYMHTALERLVDALENAPDTPLAGLDVMPAAERRQLLVEWNDTAADYPRACAHELFEAQAARTPEAVAVAFEDRQLSYAELNARANRLAHRLIDMGVGREVLVGICLERCPEMVIALIAILKAGGAYVPIDPMWPPERVRLVAEDAHLAAAVTRQDLADRLPPSVTRVFIDPRPETDASEAENNPELAVSPTDPVYVLYTSGTTSLPKGVLIEHSHLVQYVRAVMDRLHLEATGSYAMLQPLTVDSCHTTIFTALGGGGTLHLISEERALEAAKLAEYFGRHCIDYLKIAPSHLAALLDQLPSVALLPARTLIIGGEASHWDFVDRLRSLGPQCEIWNHYGPTETTVGVSACRLDPAAARAAKTVPIGRPLPNTRFYVLDQELRPVPAGLPGELCVGGEQIARCYLNRPELTAEKFIPDPFSEEEGARLYRTGDLVRYLPDRNVEFLSRLDDQVKIRGFRIEPGEIEAVLCEHAAVRQAVVEAREDIPGDKRLVAYVVPVDPALSDIEPFRALARERLPDYMRPAAYVLLRRLPLSAHGKVDRKSLPVPDAQAYATGVYEEPVGEVETRLAAIWAEVLRLDKVGRHDNFFELGGHSLLAVSVIERMRRAGLHVDIRPFFATPTVAALAAEAGNESCEVAVPANGIPPGCDKITPDMLSLVTLTLEEIGRVVASVPGGAVNVQDIYGLTPLQEGIFFHHMATREADPYQVQLVFSFDSRKRLDSYVQALQAVVDRHDVLRTSVLSEGLSQPVQVVWRQAPLVVEEVRLDAADGDVAQQLSARFDSGKFRLDISQAPLLRLFIAQDAVNERWLMLQVHHHLAIDQTTLDVIQDEVLAHLQGRSARLPTPVPYRNFVAQSRLRVLREEHEAFFRDMLGDVDETTAPFGLTDIHGGDSDITESWQRLDASVASRLRERARALGVGAASLLHLAWAKVLARVSGRDDVVFGTVLFGRVQAGEGSSRAPGMFMNTLPIRIRVDAESVAEAVRRTHLQLGQLLSREHAPLSLAQRCSAIPAPTPLFSALLNCRRIGDGGLPVKGSKFAETWSGIEVLKINNRTNYPLLLSIDDSAEGFALHVQVQSPVDPERVCTYMQTALERLVDVLEKAPTSPLASLDVMPAAERHQLLVEWNDTAADYPREKCVQQLFEEQAARTPEAIAVACKGAELRYGELNVRANRLAHHLISLGVGPDTLVGVCMERSLELVVSLLGILKAGGAYVPLDPNYPPARLAFMLEDAGAPVLLTLEALVDQLPDYGGCILSLDRDWDLVAGEPDSNPPCRTMAQNLAYVIFTSGSTGKPKGTLLPHATLVNLMTWHAQGASDGRVAQFASISFDASLQEMLAALLNGKTLVIVDDATRLQPDKLAAFLEEQAIADLFVPNVVVEYLAQAVVQGKRRLPALAHVYHAGEALTITPVIREFFANHPGCRLHNIYGPSETHVVTGTTLPVDPQRWPHRPVIGAPISNTCIYILDRNQRPTPVGVAGELYIGGDNLARGYLNRPDLTAERFVSNPFSRQTGERLYRTGDLARYLADGNIEFLGRLDDQVKIRGFRIEPGEIESVLGDHPSVRQVVVQLREDTPGDKRLVAYVVPADPGFSDTEPLRALLREHLPHYMRPAAYVVLDDLPLMANGKIDHKALPVPDGQAYASGYEAPVGEIESMLAEIWAEVLKLEKVGRNDNFFEIGGNSLVAVRVASRLHDRAKVEMPILMLFKSPTIATLAERFGAGDLPPSPAEADTADAKHFIIQQPAEVSEDDGLTPIERIYSDQFDIVRTWPGKRATPESLIVSHNISGRRQGLFWCLQAAHELKKLSRSLGPDQPVHGMRSGHLIMVYSDENLEALVELYTAEMIALQPDGPFLIGGNCQGSNVAHAIALRLRALGRKVSLLILMEHTRFLYYDGPVALIFGRDSLANPFRPPADPLALMEAGFPPWFKPVVDPDAVFRKAYPAGVTVDFMEGSHGQFFTSPNIESLAATLNKLLFDESDRNWILSHFGKTENSRFEQLFLWRTRNSLKSTATWGDIVTYLNKSRFDIPSPDDFCEDEYLSVNPDVAEACRKGIFRSGFEHYVKHGRGESRRRPGRIG